MEDRIIERIVCDFGTPVYIYENNTIVESVNKLRESLLSKVDVFYSVKANPSLAICKIMKSLGCCSEVASAGELYLALEAGFDPKDILFTSPGKTEEELEYAISKNIFCINVESIYEVYLINEIAGRLGKHIDIAIRINPDFSGTTANIRMTGVSSQFGIDISQFDDFIKKIKGLKYVSIIGLHVYLGTQILHSAGIINNFENILRIAERVVTTYGLCLEFIDLGGGFGIPYFPGEEPLNLNILKSGLLEIMNRHVDFMKHIRLIVESGRFLTAESGYYVTKVLYRKESKGNSYLICDGGSNQHASSAFLGRHIRNNFPMHVLNKKGELEEINVVGPLCTPTDVIGQKVKLPKAIPGDYIVIEKSGAYGLTNSPIYFLSHVLPAEVLYFGNKAYLIRERGSLENLMCGQLTLPEEV